MPAVELPLHWGAELGVLVMDGIIYLIGLVVVLMAILSFLGLR